MNQERAQSVIDFWFKELKPEQWFKKDEKLDKEIRERFENLWESTKDKELEELLDSPKVTLAAVIVLDQFPRNMFRGKPKSFSTDDRALELTQEILLRGTDKKLSASERVFLYMPFQHSENLEVQKESLRLYTELGNENIFPYAKEHHRIVAKFGRFPHRNQILGRTSTEEEREFMSGHSGF